MGFIKCCYGMRKAKTFALEPTSGFVFAQIDYLEECPVCGKRTLQLTRIDLENNVTVCTYTNADAVKIFEKLQTSIKYEVKDKGFKVQYCSGFYLYYNEHGKKKKCFSNLSTLKMGLFANLDLTPKGLIAV